MPSPILHQGAVVLCAHGGQAHPTAPSPRIHVAGQPIVTLQPPYLVTGCPFIPPAGNGPCITARWTSGATRVFASGSHVVLANSPSICTPTGTPLHPITTQTRVQAT